MPHRNDSNFFLKESHFCVALAELFATAGTNNL